MGRKPRIGSVRGEGEDIIRLIVDEVKNCDAKIKEYLLKHDAITPEDFEKIDRPSLVRERLKVLEKLGWVSKEGDTYYRNALTDKTPINELPINSDRIDKLFGTPSKKMIVNIVYRHRPLYIQTIIDCLKEEYGVRLSRKTVTRSLKRLIDMGFVKYTEGFGFYTDYYFLIDVDEIRNYLEDLYTVKRKSTVVLKNE